MDDLNIKEEEEEEKEEVLLDLSLSLATRRRKTKGNNNTESSSSGHDHLVGLLLQKREQMLSRENSPIRIQSAEQQNEVLVQIARSVDESDLGSAISGVMELYDTAWLTGDSVQRLAAYFADAFTAKLLPSLGQVVGWTSTAEEELLAFTHLYRVSPCFQLSHFTANQAILEAFEQRRSSAADQLHVLDFDLAYGFQWPSLVQSLSDKATPTNPVSFRITAFATTTEHLLQTEARLVTFASSFTNLVFHFHGLLFNSNLNLVKTTHNETLAVNLVLTSTCLQSNHTLMNWIRSLHPSIVVLVDQGRQDPLRYYTALFGSLDQCLPRDNLDRLCIERILLAKHIKNAVLNCFTYDSLHMMEEHGFSRMNLSSTTLMQANLLLRIRNHNPAAFLQPHFNSGFKLSQTHNGKAISLFWQDTELLTASAWQPAV